MMLQLIAVHLMPIMISQLQASHQQVTSFKQAQSNSNKKIKGVEDDCDSSASSSLIQSQLEQHFIGTSVKDTHMHT